MSQFWTTVGLARWFGYGRGETLPANYHLALATSALVPDQRTETFSEVTEIAVGNGYATGGQAIAPSSFPTLVTVPGASAALDVVRLSFQVSFSASGGPIPASGSGARYALLLDANATIADRQVIIVWDLGSDFAVSDGEILRLNLIARFRHP